MEVKGLEGGGENTSLLASDGSYYGSKPTNGTYSSLWVGGGSGPKSTNQKPCPIPVESLINLCFNLL